MATFQEVIESAGLPEQATEPIRKAWDTAFTLTSQNNERIAQINAARAQDPNNTEYLDSLWKIHAKNDPEMAQVEAQFDEVAEMYEKLNKRLRDFAKTKVPTPLSEEETRNARKLVNESGDAIKTARDKYMAMAEMFDGILTSMGKGVEGGLGNLLPEADSLKNLRGRRAATGEKSNITRIGAFEINGRPIHRDGKANFRYGADSVSIQFGAEKFPENKVTGEEIETAFFEAIDKPYRSLKSTEIPDSTTFGFTKEVKIGEGVTEKRTVNITIKKVVNTESSEPKSESKPEAKPETSDEKPAPTSAPAKKAAAAPAKK